MPRISCVVTLLRSKTRTRISFFYKRLLLIYLPTIGLGSMSKAHCVVHGPSHTKEITQKILVSIVKKTHISRDPTANLSLLRRWGFCAVCLFVCARQAGGTTITDFARAWRCGCRLRRKPASLPWKCLVFRQLPSRMAREVGVFCTETRESLTSRWIYGSNGLNLLLPSFFPCCPIHPHVQVPRSHSLPLTFLRSTRTQRCQHIG